ncbi:MAG TPA: ATP-binding protein [Vicinamibacterales bacterium]|nr:ATP-binding protein [Vicinamibacterales bacterium]
MRKLAIALTTAAVVLTLSALRAVDLWRWRSETLNTSTTRAANLSNVLAAYVNQTFAAGDAALGQLAVHSLRAGGPEAPAADWAAPLDAALASLAGVGSISVADRNGIIRHSTQPRIVGQSRADDFVFRRLREAAGEGVAVGLPFLSVTEPRQYLIPVGRRLVDPAGRFAGAVVATFVPAELRSFFRTVATGPRGIVWVFHPNGVVVFREPSEENPIGSSARGNPIFEAAAAGHASGIVEGAPGPDGRAKISAYQTTSRLPLVVAISMDRGEALAEWRRVAFGSLSFFGVACLLFVAVHIVLFDQMDAKARAEGALREAERQEHERLAEANRQLTESLEREHGARRDAETANALKDQFLMTVSHELRTPLTAIYGWARMLVTGAVRDGQREAAIQTIERNARAQVRIIDDLLDTARVMNGKLRLDLRPTDAAAVVRDAVETVRPGAAARSIALSVRAAEGCELLADAERLQQIVWNLVSNAVKFTPPGGRVDVVLAKVGAEIEIAVSDTGDGISPGFLPHVFDRFRQQDGSTKRRYGGLGLGLAIVRSLAELHGGHVSAESAGEGRGSTFRVRLPARRQDAATPPAEGGAPAAEPDRAGALGGLRILIVDDEPEARALFAAVLHDAGAQVDEASSAAEALDALARDLYDVLLSDIEMPGADGYGLAADARALASRLERRLTAIAVTAYSRPEDEARSLASGFERHLSKPVDPGVLVSAIVELRSSNRSANAASR